MKTFQTNNMRSRILNTIKQTALLAASALFLFSCVNDDDFDVPEFIPESQEVFGGGGEGAVFQGCFSEDFESFAIGTTEFTEYENVSSFGTRLWEVASFSGNQYLVMSAFRANGLTYSYFVFPVDFSTADILRFKTQDRFNNGGVLSVYTTTDYQVSDNIVNATLNEITPNVAIASGTTGGTSQAFVPSGSYDLSGLSGNGFVVFKYEGDGNGTTTTMHIDDIELFDTDIASCVPQDPCTMQDFEGFSDQQQNLPDYQNIGATEMWEIDEFSDNKYLRFSAFGTTGPQDNWFIMGVDFSAAEKLSFKTQEAFDNGSVLSVLYSTNYDELGDPSTATWTDITSNFTIASGNATGFGSFINSGEFDLGGISGNGYLAFRYVGDATGISTRMHVDDILLTNSTGAPCSFALAAPPAPVVLVYISELADPNNNSGARFVELYNAGTAPVNLGTGWYLTRWTNANTSPSTGNDIMLTGTIAPGATYVVSPNGSAFTAAYGFAPDQAASTGGPADSNGDDQIALVDDTGTTVDFWGVIGEDGSGTGHEFEDGRANRKLTVTAGNPTWTQSEWDIWNDTGGGGTIQDPQDAPADFTPGVR